VRLKIKGNQLNKIEHRQSVQHQSKEKVLITLEIIDVSAGDLPKDIHISLEAKTQQDKNFQLK